jgi:hypothetical protein
MIISKIVLVNYFKNNSNTHEFVIQERHFNLIRKGLEVRTGSIFANRF